VCSSDLKDKKRAEVQKELTEAALAAISQLADDAFARTLESFDKQIRATEKTISDLQAKAAQGQLDADESIALEQQRAAELEKKRLEEQRKQLIQQAAVTVLNTFNANVAANVDNPLAKTAIDVAVLRSLASTLSSFKDGTEDTGKGGNLDKDGGFKAILHKKERVLTKEDNAPLLKLGISNKELSYAGQLYKNGAFTDTGNMFSKQSLQLNGLGNSAVVAEVRGVKNAIEAQKMPEMPETSFTVDQLRNLLTITTREGNKVTTERSKLHG